MNVLQDLQETERQDVLQYYEDYFEEGGADQEEQIILTLGSPEHVAAVIKGSLNTGEEFEYGEYTECGYQDERFQENKDTPQRYMHSFEEKKEKPKLIVDKERNRRNWILLGIIAVVFLTVIGPSIIGLLVVVVIFAVLRNLKEKKAKKKVQKMNDGGMYNETTL